MAMQAWVNKKPSQSDNPKLQRESPILIFGTEQKNTEEFLRQSGVNLKYVSELADDFKLTQDLLRLLPDQVKGWGYTSARSSEHHFACKLP